MVKVMGVKYVIVMVSSFYRLTLTLILALTLILTLTLTPTLTLLQWHVSPVVHRVGIRVWASMVLP